LALAVFFAAMFGLLHTKAQSKFKVRYDNENESY